MKNLFSRNSRTQDAPGRTPYSHDQTQYAHDRTQYAHDQTQYAHAGRPRNDSLPRTAAPSARQKGGRPGGRGGTKSGKHPRRLRHAQRKFLAAGLLGVAATIVTLVLVPRPQGEPVVVATHSLQPGTQIEAADVATRTFPTNLVPEDALTDTAQVVGTTSAAAVNPGTPLTRASLLEEAPATVPAGHVRVPISLTDQAASSILKPGHRVQIYSTVDQDAATLVEEAVVVAVATAKDPFAGETRVVTLAVAQADAPKLAGGTGLGFALLGDSTGGNLPGDGAGGDLPAGVTPQS